MIRAKKGPGCEAHHTDLPDICIISRRLSGREPMTGRTAIHRRAPTTAPGGTDQPPLDPPRARRRRTAPAVIGSLAAALLVLAGPGTAGAQAATEGAQRLVEAALHDTTQ